MPRTPEDNQQIRDARREEILVAAASVFAKQGYGQTKMADIAKAAGYSHGLVYHYFASKEAVFQAIVDVTMERVVADLSLSGATPMARLEGIVDRVLERVAGAPEVGVLLSQILLFGGVPDVARASVATHVAQFQRVWVGLIRDGQRLGEITTEASAEELAGMLLCTIRGLSIVAHGTQMLAPGASALRVDLPSRATILRFLRPSVADSATARERNASRKNPQGAHATSAARVARKKSRTSSQ